MDAIKKGLMMKKIKTFATMAGKLNALQQQAQQKKQEELEQQNLMNLEVEKGIAQEKFFTAVARKNKTEMDSKVRQNFNKSNSKSNYFHTNKKQLILSNIQDYESIVKLFGKDTEQAAKIMLVKGMQLESYQKGQVIIKQNDPSNNKFYVIAKGSVVIVKATDTNVFQQVQKEENNNQNIDDKKRQSQIGIDGRRSSMPIQKKEPEDPLKIEIQKYGKEINTLNIGQGFGDAAILESDPRKAKRGATILAREDNTQMIIIMKREFQKFKDTFSSQGKEKAQILSHLIPQLKQITSTQTRDDLIFYFQEEGGLRGQALTVEDKAGDKIYILKEGQVQIEKNYVNQKNIYYHDIQKIKISTISDNSFFGEEILQTNDENQKYSYTITISSIQARYYTIKKQILMFKFPNLIKDILNEYVLKERHRKKTVEYILSKNQQSSNMVQVGDTLHEYNKLKNFELFSQMKNQMVEIHNKNIFKDIAKIERFQTPENLSRMRQEMMKEFEDKKFQSETKAPSSNQNNQFEDQSSSQIQSLNKRRNTTTLQRQSLKLTEQQNQASQIQINNLVSENSERNIKNNHPLKLNNAGASASSLKFSSSQNMLQDTPAQSIQRNSLTKQTLPTQLPLDPVYSKVYQEQHDYEQNFMENIQEKIKLMSKAQQNPKESPQLDLGYLDQFKKKQQHKIIIYQKTPQKVALPNNNRMSVMQKKIDQIKNKYSKEPEQEIIIQDGQGISGTNSNNIVSIQFSKTNSESTPQNNLSNNNDSFGTPISSKGIKGMRQFSNSTNVNKYSSFKTEQMTPKNNSELSNMIVRSNSSQFIQNSSPQLKSQYIVPQTYSIPSLFALNSQRENTINNTNQSLNMSTPLNIKNNNSGNIIFSNRNSLSVQALQTSQFKSQGSLLTQPINSINEKQESSESQQGNQFVNSFSGPKQTPIKKQKTLTLENLPQNLNYDEKLGLSSIFFSQYQSLSNNFKQDIQKIQNISLQEPNQEVKNSQAIQVQHTPLGQVKKDQLFNSIFTPNENVLKISNNSLDFTRCSSAAQLRRKSLSRQKLRTGLSFQRKSLINQNN